MLWLITGGIGSGKSVFAEDLALTLGCEGIKLYCPPFPIRSSLLSPGSPRGQGSFSWTIIPASENLAAKLTEINLESNIFRADRRVIIIDSLSGIFRHLTPGLLPYSTDLEGQIEAKVQEIMKAILSFEGKIIIITEEITAGLSMLPQELWFSYKLAEANRILSEESITHYQLVSGTAAEVKGYRVKQRRLSHENLHEDR